ncbi:MAG: DUF5309 family protein [Rhodobacteraceae bacterium]|nr:DUF5309 family protein [Paracoccaceae bacterium]
MSDLFNLSNLGVSDNSGNGPGAGASLGTGDLRRKYNFGDRVSELSVSQDPFFRFLSKVSKKSTDDPSFKFTEKRQSFHKRYAYLINHGSVFSTAVTSSANSQDAKDDTFYGKFGTDYKNKGNLVNRYGQTISYAAGDADTKPLFFIPGQLLKVPVADTSDLATAGTAYGYQVVRIDTVADNGNYINVTGKVVKPCDSGSYYMGAPASVAVGATTTTGASEESLAPYKCYVVGSAHAEGSGYPETWKDQPYSTNYGRTQIWKTSMAMTNTARATVLKYDKNEWARVWKEKLVEHKWDIEQSLLFGRQDDDYLTTQGAVDYISSYGNLFDLNISTKTADDFLDDMSAYLDPRYNSSNATVYFVNTAVYNWMHKLGGYFKNNLEISPNMRADFAMSGKKKVAGIDITTFSTPYGDMNVSRNIHLDGTDVKMLGINMKHVAYRPLAGNGINRDTSVYVGVQTLENSGIDRRVDLILTEAGMEWSCPETHAVWK